MHSKILKTIEIFVKLLLPIEACGIWACFKISYEDRRP
jgi:hypothetical protein